MCKTTGRRTPMLLTRNAGALIMAAALFMHAEGADADTWRMAHKQTAESIEGTDVPGLRRPYR
jgi:hypothetical protein